MIDYAHSAEFLALQAAVAGRYSLDREIGRGGMGIVFLAKDVSLERLVAIKLLPPDMAERSDLRRRFLLEARTAAKLSHPNIVPIHAVEESGDLVFFVMSYIEGGTLGDRIATSGPLPLNEGVRILREIAWALSYAHSQGVVHRDVKPDNIVLEKGSGRAVVMDFGIAHAQSTTDDAAHDEVLGTPEFMSPEQATGEPVDARSDLYSLGIVAFLVMSGRLPFNGGSSAEKVAHHIRTSPPRLTSVAPGISRKVSGIVDRCLAKEPDDRIQTGASLAEALGGALEVPKETPVALRVFIREGSQGKGTVWALLFLYLLFPILGFAGLLFGQGSLGGLVGLGVIGAIVATPIGLVIHRARRLAKAGLRREDLVDALEAEHARRREELAFVYGEDHAQTSRLLGKLSTGLVVAGVVFIGVAIANFSGGWGTSGVLSLLAGGVVGSTAAKRNDRRGRWRIKFWRSRLAKWIFKLVGKGSPAAVRSVTFTNRPTELAVGSAVSSLFESLPKETRSELGNLPDVVRGLEDDAQRMRARVEELNDLLGGASAPIEAGHDGLDAQRERAEERIRSARDAAQRRLTQTVAALENLRIDLLRMRAGTVDLDGVTESLGAARDLNAQVELLLEGHDEIHDVLLHKPTA